MFLFECKEGGGDVGNLVGDSVGKDRRRLFGLLLINSVIIGVLILFVSVCILIVWVIVMKLRRREVEEVKMFYRF